MTTSINSPIIIVGAGGTGCTLALLLAKYNIPTILIERRESTLKHPAAHVLNARSFEIWSEYSTDLANEIMDLCPAIEELSEIRWCTSLLGTQLGRLHLSEYPERLQQVLSFSPYRIAHVGQHQLMPILWQWVREEPLINLITGASIENIQDHSEHVEATVKCSNGQILKYNAKWLIGADGANSTVRNLLGIKMSGPVLANMASVFFNMKLDSVHPGARPLLSWIYNPSFCGVLIKHANDDYILMSPYLCEDQNIATAGVEYWKKIIPKAIGTTDIPFNIHTTGKWSMTAQLAERYGKGRSVLIGDAAHRFPHTGGFGLNSGVQDAHNLAWKFAAVLEGRANGSLITQTYEAERKPVINLFSSQSVNNHFKLDEVTRHIGLQNRKLTDITKLFESGMFSRLPRFARKQIAELLMKQAFLPMHLLGSRSFIGAHLRRNMAKEIPGQLEHFASTGLEFGFAYSAGMVIPERTPQPIVGNGVTDYRPTTWPGSRLPHVSVTHEERTVPIHRLIDKRTFTLISAAGDEWESALAKLPKKTAMGITVLNLETQGMESIDRIIAMYEVGPKGAVLVRPDQHVAWRTKKSAEDGVNELLSIENQLFARYMKTPNEEQKAVFEHSDAAD